MADRTTLRPSQPGSTASMREISRVGQDAVRAQPGSEPAHRRGKLKVFLSYAPGTGKTLAMLQDAFRSREKGMDVVVGYVDARLDTLASQLLDKFEILSHRVIAGSGLSYYGMDIDQILERRPQVVLVDYLARENPPGTRHTYRYLEVDELLNSGIDVYTTLNIFQIASQVDPVQYLTGVTVRETVPDRFLDEADMLELVDLPPQDLLEQYQAGKIFIAPRFESQTRILFQPGHLFALRELTLRYMAHRSNKIMRSYLKAQGWERLENSAPALLVCISDSPDSSRLVRAGRRMADETHADWTVVFVETPELLERQGDWQASVTRSMRLAEMLGAKTVTLTGRTAGDALRDYIRKNHYRRIMIGRSSRLKNLLGGSLTEQLLREDASITIYMVGGDLTPRPVLENRTWHWMSRMQLLASLALVALPTLLGLALSPVFFSRSANQVMLYLLAVVIASVFLGLIPALLTAVLSILVFDYFFIPPVYRLFGFASEYTVTFASLLLVSVIVSTLVSRQRALTKAAQRRADQVTQLYELSKDLATAVDMQDILDVIIRHVQATFQRDSVVLLPKDGSLVLSASSSGETLETSELTAAEWAFQQGRPAGHNTGTFSYASFRYLPLQSSRGVIGVMGVRLDGPDNHEEELHPEQTRLLSTFVTKAASAIERALFAEEAGQAQVLRATEKLQSALLNSISHDLRTPLASITGVLSSLRIDDDFLDPETRQELVETALGEAERLNRLVGNLLDMSRIESGAIRISLQPCDIQDVIGSALNSVSARLEGHPVEIDLAADLPLVPLDFVLINQVLINLLDNAAKYSPEGGAVRIRGLVKDAALRVEIEDEGPGIPEEDLERIFEKFYRVKRLENVVGTGLGLSICKGIIEVHGGTLWAENRSGGGLRMIFTLPLKQVTLDEDEPAVHTLREGIQT